MDYYKIQLTQKGDYIVRQPDTREVARLATREEAEAWIMKKNEEHAAEMADQEHDTQEQTTFDNTVPDLIKLQIRWQNWRSWLYSEIQRTGKNLAHKRMHLDNVDSSLPSYAHHEHELTKDQQELVEANDLYNRAVIVDTSIKAARRTKDQAELERLLVEEAEPIIEKMNQFFVFNGRPEEYKPVSKGGTKPDTSLFLGEERKEWLREHGGIQPTIQALIDKAMKS